MTLVQPAGMALRPGIRSSPAQKGSRSCGGIGSRLLQFARKFKPAPGEPADDGFEIKILQQLDGLRRTQDHRARSRRPGELDSEAGPGEAPCLRDGGVMRAWAVAPREYVIRLRSVRLAMAIAADDLESAKGDLGYPLDTLGVERVRAEPAQRFQVEGRHPAEDRQVIGREPKAEPAGAQEPRGLLEIEIIRKLRVRQRDVLGLGDPPRRRRRNERSSSCRCFSGTRGR